MKNVFWFVIICSIISCNKQEVFQPIKDVILIEKPDERTTSNIIKRIEFNGSWYWLGIPETKTKKRFPIIIVLHGDEGHPNNMKFYWEDLWKTKQDFIFIAPECPRGIIIKG
ncbi:hypothetical protein [Tenacibaculum sp. C7A-26P2]|uniref:hypothetical protein n=1 Tax=Tenacibaculum sp. C7A-26P2 TaxID=3447504 RepID=UPI003F85280B